MTIEHQRVADAPERNWVDRFAPLAIRPYMRLARLDRPIGTWLLLWPCLWSIALADLANGDRVPSIWLLILFSIGAIVMRGAGCVYNDLVDKDFDGRVERTRSRPIPSGQVSVRNARIYMISLSLVGFLVLIQLNWISIKLGILSLAIVAIYPFMKRFTYWPQIFLGLAFSWGALMGWAAVRAEVTLVSVILYASAISWTIGYDTIYAHQDKEDDALLGLKSTALKFGESTKSWLSLFFGLALALLALCGWLLATGMVYWLGLTAATAHGTWQITTLDIADRDNCLRRFRSNRDFGLIIFCTILLQMAVGN
ncbi:MAG: 4-hydroxybenzoate octaprenyltransferase [Methyloligellaceae bacterium]